MRKFSDSLQSKKHMLCDLEQASLNFIRIVVSRSDNISNQNSVKLCLKLRKLSTGFIVASILFVDPVPAAEQPSVKPPFSWTGFYAGAVLGGAFTGSQNINTWGNDPFTVNNMNLYRRVPHISFQHSSILIGGEIGYDYQFSPDSNSFVAGIAADMSFLGMTKRINAFGTPIYPRTPITITAYKQNLDGLGMATGHLGYTFDRLLVYGLGGLAYGQVTYAGRFLNPVYGHALAYTGSFSGVQVGYAVGGGLAYALNLENAPQANHQDGGLSLKVEYVRYDLGQKDVLMKGGFIAASMGSYSSRYDTKGNLMRVGLDYRFGESF